MNALRFVLIFTCFYFSMNSQAEDAKLDPTTQKDLITFFNNYLGVYNQRFGKPELSKKFRTDIVEFMHFPLMLSPPKGAPRVIAEPTKLAENFESFVSTLEKRGVTKLQWKNLQFHPLSDNKILANNMGHGVNTDGEVLYETVSLYLLYQNEGDWHIALFSPYMIENAADIRPAEAV